MALAPLRPTDQPNYGPYRLQGRLGSGGMGIVYLAFGPDNAPVALKVLQPVLADDEEYRVRFIREVTAARLVDSPFVARVVDADTQADPLWMAAEYVEGATLDLAVASNGPVPPDRLRGLASDLANAVAALHAVGLVHRDLKPANVVLAWSGPKLIDFGIAKHEGMTDLTQAGVTVGSLLWMSPEVLNGEPAGRAGDVFAWGLCVAFAGTGRPPFGTGNPNAVAYRIAREQPDLQGLPNDMARLVEAALAKDPRARPTADALISALGGRGPQATAVAIPRPDGGWTGPNPGSHPEATVHLPPPPPPAVSPPAGRRRQALLLLAVLALLLIAAGIAIAILVTGDKHTPPQPAAPPRTSATPSPTQSGPPTPSTASSGPSAPASAAMTLDGLLSDSARDRADVVSAVAAVAACNDPANAATTLQQAAAGRAAELQRLPGIDLSALDPSGRLGGSLTAALTESRAADLSFAAWAATATGCSGNVPPDSNYVSASNSSMAASASKQEFINLWNPIAKRFGLTIRKISDI